MFIPTNFHIEGKHVRRNQEVQLVSMSRLQRRLGGLEVRELPLPEPNLTRWRRHLGLTVGTGDSEVGGHEASHSGRHGTAKDDLVFKSPVRLMPVLVND